MKNASSSACALSKCVFVASQAQAKRGVRAAVHKAFEHVKDAHHAGLRLTVCPQLQNVPDLSSDFLMSERFLEEVASILYVAEFDESAFRMT